MHQPYTCREAYGSIAKHCTKATATREVKTAGQIAQEPTAFPMLLWLFCFWPNLCQCYTDMGCDTRSG